MKNRRKISKTPEEIKVDLMDQLELLEMHCNTYDSGNDVVGKHIAVILRTLFHEGSGRSRSLLKLAGIRDISWIDSSHGLHTDNNISECSLLLMRITNGKGGEYRPNCFSEYKIEDYRYRLFPDWWSMPVILDDDKNIFTRSEIVAYVADTDGGAHVDAELDEEYKNLRRPNYLGWNYFQNGNSEAFSGKIELICMKQIAFEVLYTLRNKHKELFREK